MTGHATLAIIQKSYCRDLEFVGILKKRHIIFWDAFADTDQVTLFDMLRMLSDVLKNLLTGDMRYLAYPLAFIIDFVKAFLACFQLYKARNRNASQWTKTILSLIKCLITGAVILNSLATIFCSALIAPLLIMSSVLMRSLYRLTLMFYHGHGMRGSSYSKYEKERHLFFFLHNLRGFLLSSILVSIVITVLILHLTSAFTSMITLGLVAIALNGIIGLGYELSAK